MYQKSHSYDVQFLRHGGKTIFEPFLPFYPPKIKILKEWNTTWRFYHFTYVYHKWQSYDVWFLRYGAWWTEFFLSFWTTFCPPTNLKTQKVKFKKMKKNPGYIIILHMCTINDNHMMYGWWDIEHDEQIFLSFWTIFHTFTPKNSKNLNFEKMKKHLEIWSFYANIPKIMIICCTVPEIGCVRM